MCEHVCRLPRYRCQSPVRENNPVFRCDGPLCVECLQGPPSPLVVLRGTTKDAERASKARSKHSIQSAHPPTPSLRVLVRSLLSGVGWLSVRLRVRAGNLAFEHAEPLQPTHRPKARDLRFRFFRFRLHNRASQMPVFWANYLHCNLAKSYTLHYSQPV